MHAFPDLPGVHETLAGLIERELVARLERRPGHKEERYAQLLQAHDAEPTTVAADVAAADTGMQNGLSERVERLEREVAQLRAALAARAYGHQP